MEKPRRQYLYTLMLFLGGGTAGCMSGGTQTGSDGADAMTTVQKEDLPMQCQGEPITVEKTVTDVPGYEDGREYFSDNETVRVVRASDESGPTEFSTMPVSEWVMKENLFDIPDRVVGATKDRLDTADDWLGSSLTKPPETVDVNEPFAVGLHLTQKRAPLLPTENETITPEAIETKEAEISAHTLVTTAPALVDITYTIDGDTISVSIPVFAKE